MRSRHAIVAGLLLTLLGACGSADPGAGPTGPGTTVGPVTAALEPLGDDALPGRPGHVVPLDAAAVAGEAVEPAELQTLLEGAGFAGGIERAFAQTQGPRLQRSIARVLAFADAAGATAYLGWLEQHVDDLLGTAELLDPPQLPGVAFLAHADPDCCPKAKPIYLVGWRRGPTVVTLEVAGDGIDEGTVTELARTLDATVAS